MSIWSDDLKVVNALPPRKILQTAADELAKLTDLKVTIELSQLSDRVVMGFVARNETTNKTSRLFEVSHELDHNYPVRIDPPKQQLPEFLRNKVYVPAPSEQIRFNSLTRGETVVNEWVCSTPDEFRKKLAELAGDSYVKARIVSLANPDIDEDLIESNA